MQPINPLGRAERVYVQYGCGWCAPPLWRNFDASPVLRFERIPLLGRLYTKNHARFPANAEYGDISQGLPIAESVCDGVYCSHVLEHLSLEDCEKALKNTHKILKEGGIFRLVMPDLEQYIMNYVNDRSPEAAMHFMQETALGTERMSQSIVAIVRKSFGHSQHYWLWDYKSIERKLQDAGFKSIRRAQWGDGQDTAFMEVEDQDRWAGFLGVECKK